MPAYLIWFLIGAALLLAELAVPGLVLIFFGLGGLVTALVSYIWEFSVELQVVIFVLASLVLLFALRRIFVRSLTGHAKGEMDETLLEKRIIGQTAVVTSKLGPHGKGEIKCMGSYWRAVADQDIEEGSSVTVLMATGDDRLTYKVEPLGQKEQDNG